MLRTGKELSCKQCNKIFYKPACRIKQGRGVYCSKECYKKYTNGKKDCICLNCKKHYQIFKSQAGDKFCNIECLKQYSPKTIKKCKWCDKEITVLKSREKGDRGKYCNKECYYESMKLDKEEKRKRANDRVRRYRKKRNEWYIATKQRRRALKISVSGHFTAKQWRELKEKNNFTCLHCKRKEPEIKLTADHIIPLFKWKEWAKENKPNYKGNDIDNIQPLCGQCNSAKGTKT